MRERTNRAETREHKQVSQLEADYGTYSSCCSSILVSSPLGFLSDLLLGPVSSDGHDTIEGGREMREQGALGIRHLSL